MRVARQGWWSRPLSPSSFPPTSPPPPPLRRWGLNGPASVIGARLGCRGARLEVQHAVRVALDVRVVRDLRTAPPRQAPGGRRRRAGRRARSCGRLFCRRKCPVSTGRRTRRVQLVRGEGRDVSSQYRKGVGGGHAPPRRPKLPASREARAAAAARGSRGAGSGAPGAEHGARGGTSTVD